MLSMLSSLIFRRKAMPSSPAAAADDDIRTPKHSIPVITQDHLGLKTLAHPNSVNRNILIASSKSPSPPPPPPPYPSPSQSKNSIHEIFEEEEEKEEENEEDTNGCCWAKYGRRRRTELRRPFPPPIPLLARTGNLTSHMPWVLKRIYRDDGSLVLQEVKVKRHEYFLATRVAGRLILHLVELDDQSSPPPPPAVFYPVGSEEVKDICADEKVDRDDHEDLEIEREKNINDHRVDSAVGITSSLRISQMAATMNVLSSSLPERVCGDRWTSLHRRRVKGTPVVRGY